MPSARNSPPASSTTFLALNSTKPPSPDDPALASRSEPARLIALRSAQVMTVPPEELAPTPLAPIWAPACRSMSRPARMSISPAFTPAAPGAAMVPLTMTSPSATMRIRPPSAMTLLAEAMPFAFTTSVKEGAVPTKRAPAKTTPPTFTVPADSVTPSIAFTLP